MALFNDGPISTAADLQQYENSILTVASTENIDLAAKILLAQQDLANEVVSVSAAAAASTRLFAVGRFIGDRRVCET